MRVATPKQYLPLLGRSLLEWSLAALLSCPWIDGVVVVLAADDAHFARLPIAGHPKLILAIGGAMRSDSVLAGLQAVQQRCICREQTRVLVHDAARPGLNAELLSALKAGDDSIHGALLALPSADTLKREVGRQSQETLNRTHIWRAQTPQLFGLLPLQNALTHAAAQGLAVTDEASAMEQLGLKPQLVLGAERNFKVTYPEDLKLAAFWLSPPLLHATES